MRLSQSRKTAAPLILGLIILSTALNCVAQTIDKEKLDNYFQALQENDRFMGNAIIYQGDKRVYSFHSGYSNVNTKTKTNPDTTFRIGSLSKTFTAVLVLKAVEEGKINLSKTIDAYFPTIENADKISISQLLNHHSGIRNFTSRPDFAQWRTKQQTEKDLITKIAEGGSNFEPGSKGEYSNSNYVLLSFILQQIYGRPYGELLKEKIITPLKLTHTFFGDTTSVLQNDKALSYTYEQGWNLLDETNLSIPMGAGAILSTAEDLASFISSLFNGKIISREKLREMETQTDGYGFGLFERSFFDFRSYTHDGKIDGFTSFFYYFPEKEALYVLLSNAENYNLNNINTAVISSIFQKPFDIPVFNRYKVSIDDMQLYPGVYSSESTPLVITVSQKNNVLLAQPAGQQVYTMDAIEKNQFLHEKSGVTLEFKSAERAMIMKQGNQTLVFTKK